MSSNFFDPVFNKLSYIKSEWVIISNMILQKIRHDSNFGLNGYKIRRKDQMNKYILRHSYICFSNYENHCLVDVYAINCKSSAGAKSSYQGKGSYGKAKLVLKVGSYNKNNNKTIEYKDSQKEIRVVKISNGSECLSPSIYNHMNCDNDIEKLEIDIARDLKQNLGFSKRVIGLKSNSGNGNVITKLNMLMPYLGVSVCDLSRSGFFEGLDLNQKLDYCLNITNKVSELFYGNLSSNKNSYLHCDLNTKNILINHQDVNLIDFGLSVKRRSFEFNNPDLKQHEGGVFVPQQEHNNTLISERTWYFAPEASSAVVRLKNGARVFLNTEDLEVLYLLRNFFNDNTSLNNDCEKLLQKVEIYYRNGFSKSRVLVRDDGEKEGVNIYLRDSKIDKYNPNLFYSIGYTSRGDNVFLRYPDIIYILQSRSLGELSKKHHNFSGMSDIYSLYFIFISILGKRYDQQNISDVKASGLSSSIIFILNLIKSTDIYSRPSFEILKLAFLYEKYKDISNGNQLFRKDAQIYRCKTTELREAKIKFVFLTKKMHKFIYKIII